ncbi:hypothetical protein PAXINDRAFT_8315 [Paxillus involutus ATCC 200175]|nr:hypothetical protein PAXINDRAFT_8315 [Paxillus involutus ATCC 200175]
MSYFEDSPRHRNEMLNDPSNRTQQSLECSPLVCSSFTGSQHPQLRNVGHDEISRLFAQWVEFASPEEVSQVLSNASLSAEVSAPLEYSCGSPSTATVNPRQYNSSYFPRDSNPAVAQRAPVDEPYALPMQAYPMPDWALGLGGGPYEPYHPPPQLPQFGPPLHFPPPPSFRFHECRWLGGPPCDGSAPGRNREMAEHLRMYHHFVGHERDSVRCEWENCTRVMQRMNIPRHIVSTHLLEVASCQFCGKRFSRPDVVARHERTCIGPASGARVLDTGF